eukprot:scaffold3324_cov371-Prasinococcus_capsulatus_cf.AAC.2
MVRGRTERVHGESDVTRPAPKITPTEPRLSCCSCNATSSFAREPRPKRAVLRSPRVSSSDAGPSMDAAQQTTRPLRTQVDRVGRPGRRPPAGALKLVCPCTGVAGQGRPPVSTGNTRCLHRRTDGWRGWRHGTSWGELTRPRRQRTTCTERSYRRDGAHKYVWRWEAGAHKYVWRWEAGAHKCVRPSGALRKKQRAADRAHGRVGRGPSWKAGRAGSGTRSDRQTDRQGRSRAAGQNKGEPGPRCGGAWTSSLCRGAGRLLPRLLLPGRRPRFG